MARVAPPPSGSSGGDGVGGTSTALTGTRGLRAAFTVLLLLLLLGRKVHWNRVIPTRRDRPAVALGVSGPRTGPSLPVRKRSCVVFVTDTDTDTMPSVPRDDAKQGLCDSVITRRVNKDRYYDIKL